MLLWPSRDVSDVLLALDGDEALHGLVVPQLVRVLRDVRVQRPPLGVESGLDDGVTLSRNGGRGQLRPFI